MSAVGIEVWDGAIPLIFIGDDFYDAATITKLTINRAEGSKGNAMISVRNVNNTERTTWEAYQGKRILVYAEAEDVFTGLTGTVSSVDVGDDYLRCSITGTHVVDEYIGAWVEFTAGDYQGLILPITDNTAGSGTVDIYIDHAHADMAGDSVAIVGPTRVLLDGIVIGVSGNDKNITIQCSGYGGIFDQYEVPAYASTMTKYNGLVATTPAASPDKTLDVKGLNDEATPLTVDLYIDDYLLLQDKTTGETEATIDVNAVTITQHDGECDNAASADVFDTVANVNTIDYDTTDWTNTVVGFMANYHPNALDGNQDWENGSADGNGSMIYDVTVKSGYYDKDGGSRNYAYTFSKAETILRLDFDIQGDTIDKDVVIVEALLDIRAMLKCYREPFAPRLGPMQQMQCEIFWSPSESINDGKRIAITKFDTQGMYAGTIETPLYFTGTDAIRLHELTDDIFDIGGAFLENGSLFLVLSAAATWRDTWQGNGRTISRWYYNFVNRLNQSCYYGIGVDYAAITIKYNTETFDPVNEKIRDNTTSGALCYTAGTAAGGSGEFDFADKGINEDDGVIICSSYGTALERCTVGYSDLSETGSVPRVRYGDSPDDYLDEGCPVDNIGLTGWGLLRNVTSSRNLLLFERYEDQSGIMMATLPSDINAATLTFGVGNIPISKISGNSTQSTACGYVRVYYKNGVTNLWSANGENIASTNGYYNIKILQFPNILTLETANNLAYEYAQEHEDNDRNVEIQLDYFPRHDFQIGTKYNINDRYHNTTTNLMADISYTDLLCKYISISWDGSRWKYTLSLGGSSPPELHVGRKIADNMYNSKTLNSKTMSPDVIDTGVFNPYTKPFREYTDRDAREAVNACSTMELESALSFGGYSAVDLKHLVSKTGLNLELYAVDAGNHVEVQDDLKVTGNFDMDDGIISNVNTISGTDDLLISTSAADKQIQFQANGAIRLRLDDDSLDLQAGVSLNFASGCELYFVDGGLVNKIQGSGDAFSDVDDELMTAASVSNKIDADIATHSSDGDAHGDQFVIVSLDMFKGTGAEATSGYYELTTNEYLFGHLFLSEYSVNTSKDVRLICVLWSSNADASYAMASSIGAGKTDNSEANQTTNVENAFARTFDGDPVNQPAYIQATVSAADIDDNDLLRWKMMNNEAGKACRVRGMYAIYEQVEAS